MEENKQSFPRLCVIPNLFNVVDSQLPSVDALTSTLLRDQLQMVNFPTHKQCLFVGKLSDSNKLVT